MNAIAKLWLVSLTDTILGGNMVRRIHDMRPKENAELELVLGAAFLFLVSLTFVAITIGWMGVMVLAFALVIASFWQICLLTKEQLRRVARIAWYYAKRVAWYAWVCFFLLVCLPLAAPEAYEQAYRRWKRWRNDPVRKGLRANRALALQCYRRWPSYYE